MSQKSKQAKALKIAERRASVAKLYKEGKTQEQIAVILSVNQATVSRDMQSLIDEWKRAGAEDVKQVRGRISQYLVSLIDFHHPRAIELNTRGQANIASGRMVLQAVRQLAEIYALNEPAQGSDKEDVRSVIKELAREAAEIKATRTTGE